MIRYLYNIFSLFIFSLLMLSCGGDDDSTINGNETPVSDNYSADDNFVWTALNSWYYFNEEVPRLKDTFNDDVDTYSSYLNGFKTSEDLFNALTREAVTEDRFSYMVEDYKELGTSLKSEYSSYGHEFQLILLADKVSVVGFVRHVFENSPAAQKGIKRGYFFTEVDGQELTKSNYRDLLDRDTYTLKLATLVDVAGQPTLVRLPGTVTLNSGSADLSPIWATNIVNRGGKKVGYLCYSNFASNYHSELNNVFKDFKAKGVNELVLDLRYNPGGSVLTAEYLASLIYSTDQSKVLGKIDYNNKHSQYDDDRTFTNEMQIKNDDFETTSTETIATLGLSKLYVLTSNSTASASEFIINGLRPYIPVVLIGEQTVGKNLGSISLYNTPNADFTEKPDDNNKVQLGLQPIVSKIYNSLGQSNYANGFEPDYSLEESLFYIDVKPLGDPDEQMFAKALELICPSCRIAPKEFKDSSNLGTHIFESSELQPNYQILDVRTF